MYATHAVKCSRLESVHIIAIIGPSKHADTSMHLPYMYMPIKLTFLKIQNVRELV